MRNKLILISFFLSVTVIAFYSCQSESEINYARYYVNGKGVYEKHCQQCHGKNGEGLQALYPPLTDTASLKQSRNQLSCFIKYGLPGNTRIINGKKYDSQMPAEEHLSNIEIAAVITYISNSFGNQQGLYDVNDADRDIKNCR